MTRDANTTAPERELMAAVLADAVRCLKGEIGPDGERASHVEEASAWIAADDPQWPFSFVNICQVLGMDPDRLRRRLLALRPALPLPAPAPAPNTARRHAAGDEVSALILAGRSLREAARTLGISVTRASTLSGKLASRLKTQRDVDIRRLRAEGFTNGALARRFNLSRVRISRICNPRRTASTHGAALATAVTEEDVSC